MKLDLTRKVAIVTGASRGIGAEVGMELAREGMDLFLTARSAADLGAVAEKITAVWPERRALVHAADLAEPHAAAGTVARAVDALGAVHLVVNCAGATRRGDFLQLTDQDWADGFALKFFGYVRMSRAAWPHLKATAGCLINIVGIAASTPNADFAIGGAVNSALINFTKALADMGLRDGVRVNAINPGYFETGRLQRLVDEAARERRIAHDVVREELRRQSHLRRFGRPQEIGRLVAFLASGEAGYIHGAAIDIDGGATRGI